VREALRAALGAQSETPALSGDRSLPGQAGTHGTDVLHADLRRGRSRNQRDVGRTRRAVGRQLLRYLGGSASRGKAPKSLGRKVVQISSCSASSRRARLASASSPHHTLMPYHGGGGRPITAAASSRNAS